MQKIKFQSAESPRTPAESFSPELPDFSLVLGGLLYQLMRRAHLSGDAPELVSRRMIALALITWLPLLALSIVEGHAWGESVKVPFLIDVDVHARFLLALPLLIVAELMVHERMRLVVGTFVKRGLVPDEGRKKFEAAIAAAMRLRNSMMTEVLLIAIVYGLGVLFIWRNHGAMDLPTWYGTAAAGKLRPTLARLVARLRESAARPVHSTALVFPAVDLDAVSLAGVADRSTARGYSPRPRRRPWLSFRHRLCLRSVAGGPGRPARRRDGEQDFLGRRGVDRLQDGTDRVGQGDALLGPGAAAGLRPTPRPHQTRGPGGIRRARPALRTRV